MAARLVEQEHVSKACNELVRAGEEPSTLKVRKMLGKGSHSTIQKFIKVWKESDEGKSIQVETLPATVDLPPEFKEGADLFIKQIFKLAEDHHASITEQIKQACDQTVESSLKEVREAVDYVEAVDQENADLKETIDTQNESLEKLQNEKADLLEQKAEVEKDANALNYRVQSLDEKLKQSESDYFKARDERNQARDKVASQEKQIVEAEKTIATLKKENELLKKSMEDQNKALADTQIQIQKLESSLAVADQQAQVDKKALKDAKAAVDEIQGELKNSTDKLNTEKQTVAGLQGELKATKAQLVSQTGLQEKVASLEAEKKNYISEIASLKTEVVKLQKNGKKK